MSRERIILADIGCHYCEIDLIKYGRITPLFHTIVSKLRSELAEHFAQFDNSSAVDTIKLLPIKLQAQRADWGNNMLAIEARQRLFKVKFVSRNETSSLECIVYDMHQSIFEQITAPDAFRVPVIIFDRRQGNEPPF